MQPLATVEVQKAISSPLAHYAGVGEIPEVRFLILPLDPVKEYF